MIRSLGTALVTLALHLRPTGSHLLDGPRTARLILTTPSPAQPAHPINASL